MCYIVSMIDNKKDKQRTKRVRMTERTHDQLTELVECGVFQNLPDAVEGVAEFYSIIAKGGCSQRLAEQRRLTQELIHQTQQLRLGLAKLITLQIKLKQKDLNNYLRTLSENEKVISQGGKHG